MENALEGAAGVKNGAFIEFATAGPTVLWHLGVRDGGSVPEDERGNRLYKDHLFWLTCNADELPQALAMLPETEGTLTGEVTYDPALEAEPAAGVLPDGFTAKALVAV